MFSVSKWSLRLLTVNGIDVRVHATFVLVLLFGATTYAEGTGFGGALLGMTFMCLLFGCVALHELGHSLVAQAFGIPVHEILLLPIGGVAKLGKDPKSPAQEFLIAIAGPLVNGVLAVVGLVVGVLWVGAAPLLDALRNPGAAVHPALTLLGALIGANVVLAVFNMLPALPMDGGRVFRAVMSFFIGHARATKIATWLGQLIAAGLFVLALTEGQLVLLLISAVVFLAAGAERQRSKMHGILDDLSAGQVCQPLTLALSPDDSLGVAVHRFLRAPSSTLPVIHHGTLLGVVSRPTLLHAVQARGPNAFVAGAMTRDVLFVDASTKLSAVQELLLESQLKLVAVREQGTLIGFLSLEDLTRAATVWQRLKQERGALSASPSKL